MKQITYTGSSKLISRIVYILNRKAQMPLDANGDPTWGTSGQVLSTDGSGKTSWVTAGGGGTTYTAGDGIDITSNVISLDYFSVDGNGKVNITYDDGN